MSEEELEMKDSEMDMSEDTDFSLDDDGLLDFGDDDLDDEENLEAFGFSVDDSKESDE